MGWSIISGGFGNIILGAPGTWIGWWEIPTGNIISGGFRNIILGGAWIGGFGRIILGVP